jgi:hypothetical protein
MTRQTRTNTELVIGMTLAEIFLLLLIVGWYGAKLESETDGESPDPRSEISALEKELEAAKREVQQLQVEVKQLRRTLNEYEAVLDWLGKHLAAATPLRDVSSVETAVKAFVANLNRGKPVCEADNILVDISLDSDRFTGRLRRRFTAGGNSYDEGQVLGDHDVEQFLSSLRAYYAERRSAGRECAFDYTLTWRNDRDFRIGKKRFETLLFPAGDKQLR